METLEIFQYTLSILAAYYFIQLQKSISVIYKDYMTERKRNARGKQRHMKLKDGTTNIY